MSIGKKATQGFTSFLYRNMLEKLVGMGAMVILARKLSPYDFGLVSITDVLLSIISIFGTTGIAEYLLAYRKGDTTEIFKAAFWLNVVITLVILAIFWIAAPFWAHCQGDPRIWKISILSGILFLFSQLQSIPKTWLSKHLQFQKQVKIQAPFILLIALGKVVAVFLNFGVYSLIIPTLLFQPILTALLYRAVDLRIDFHLYTNRWKEIYRFTRHLIGSSILARIADQGDRIILGKVLGLEKLGVFNIASQLADLVTSQIVMVTNNVLSSVLPKYVHDKDLFYNHYISFLKTFSFLMFPVLGIMFIAAKPIILFLYGTKWIAAVVPMQILIVYAMIRAVTSSYGSVMNSFHLTKESLKVSAIYTPCHVAGSFIGAMISVNGLAASIVLVKTFFINWNIKQIMAAIGKPASRWYKDMAPYFLNIYLVAAILGVAIYFTDLYNVTRPLVSMILIGISFMGIYYIIYRFFFRKELKDISVFLKGIYPRSQGVFNFLFRI